MNAWIVSHALPLVLPMILGVMSKTVTDWLKAAIIPLDNAGPKTKQAVAIAGAIVLGGLVHLIGSLLPGGCTTDGSTLDTCLAALTDPSAMQVLLGGLVAIAMKHGEQNSGDAPPAAVIATARASNGQFAKAGK